MFQRRALIAAGSAALLAAGHARAADAPVANAMHITMFNFNADLPDAERERILKIVRDLGKLPMVKSLIIDRDIQPRREGAANQWGWVSMVAIGSKADSDVYLKHPARMEMGKSFMPSQSGWIAADVLEPGMEPLWNPAGAKIRHVVMFALKDELGPEAVDRTIASLRGLGKLPMVKALSVARNTQAPSPNSPMRWALLADFRSAEDYKAFQSDPTHGEIIKGFIPTVARSATVDIAL